MERKKTILLIEDDADLMQLIKFRLRSKGYETVTAYDCIEALQRLKELAPDLIILDINLPKMSGIEFYNKISTPHGHSKYPVLVLTARADLETIFKDIEADGFMAKPFEIDKLITEIERIIKTRPHQVICLIDCKESGHVQEIKAYLESERYFVVILEDFTTLQEKAKQRKPDYIIMEYMQKEISGEEFIKKIKEDPFLCTIPVIVYSYSGFREYEKRSLEAGADRYLGKPKNCATFVTAIKELQVKERES